MYKILLLIFTALGFISCTYYNHKFPYNFNQASQLIELDEKMDEISGIFYKNDSTLYGIKDEEGEIFEINLNTANHSKIIDFTDKGDFEGICLYQEYFYILKSDGDIYKVSQDGSYEKSVFKTDKKGFDFEGITVNSSGNELLVACKKHGNKQSNHDIFIYAFDLSTQQYKEKAFLKVVKDSIHENFMPSGIAVSPSGNIFLISGVSNTIVELSPKGEIINMAQLPSIIYNQIEGICFDTKSNMFISSEKGKQDHAKIIRLNKVKLN